MAAAGRLDNNQKIKALPSTLARLRTHGAPLAAIALIGILYAWIACTADSETGARRPRDAYYNLMVQGWLQGKTSLALEAPAGLRALPNPYDPAANARYGGSMYYPSRLHDLSYFNGKLYMYFSPVPAVVAFLPFHVLTGGWLSHQQACLFFCLVGFLGAAVLMGSLHDQFFKQTGNGSLAMGLLAVGFLSLGPILLQRSDVWEVPIACAHAGWMLAILFVWRSLARPACSWTAAFLAGVCAALAIGSRPSSILCAAILFIPAVRLFQSKSEPRWARRLGAAATVFLPLVAVGAGFLAFNYARFGNVFELGQQYQLNGDLVRGISAAHFKWAFVPYNLWYYAINYRGWVRNFPFVHNLILSNSPPGHGGGDNPVGLLTNMPAIWFLLALGFGWRFLPAGQRRLYGSAVGMIAAVAIASALPLLMFYGTCLRYEFEFGPSLAILAGLGFFAFEAFSSGWLRILLRSTWYLTLAASVAFCMLLTVSLRAQALAVHGISYLARGQNAEGESYLRSALSLEPTLPLAWGALGRLHAQNQDYAEAASDFARALARTSGSAPLYASYGDCLMRIGRGPEAIAQYRQALRLRPDFAEVRNNLGIALDGSGQITEAIAQFRQALRIKPDYTEVYYNLGVALEKVGNIEEAVFQFQEVLRLQPDYPGVGRELERLQSTHWNGFN